MASFDCPVNFQFQWGDDEEDFIVAVQSVEELAERIKELMSAAYSGGLSEGEGLYSADRAPEIEKHDVRALAQAVRLGDRLDAEAMLDRIFGGTELAEAVDLGRYNSVTARAAAGSVDAATPATGV